MSEQAQTPQPPAPSVWEIVKRLGPAGILGIFAAVAPVAGSVLLFVYVSAVAEWLRSLGDAGWMVYAACFALLSGLSLMPTYAQAALGGYVFGIQVGSLAAMTGFLGGGLVGYEIARLASGDRVEKLLREHPKWQAVRDSLTGQGFWRTLGIVTLIRLPPNSPFAVTNLVLAAVKVPRHTYLLGTLIGMAPRTIATVVIGAGLHEFTKEAVEKSAPQWLWYTGIGVMVAVVYIVGTIADKALQKATKSGLR